MSILNRCTCLDSGNHSYGPTWSPMGPYGTPEAHGAHMDPIWRPWGPWAPWARSAGGGGRSVGSGRSAAGGRSAAVGRRRSVGGGCRRRRA